MQSYHYLTHWFQVQLYQTYSNKFAAKCENYETAKNYLKVLCESTSEKWILLLSKVKKERSITWILLLPKSGECLPVKSGQLNDSRDFRTDHRLLLSSMHSQEFSCPGWIRKKAELKMADCKDGYTVLPYLYQNKIENIINHFKL